MIRNLKVLGLALAAVFALSAVAASAASALNGLLTSSGNVTLTGSPVFSAKNDNSLTVFGNVVTCAKATYTGHKVKTFTQTKEAEETGLSLHEFLPNGSSSVTITPHYSLCITTASGLEFQTTIDMNGCDFEFDLGETAIHESTFTVYKVKATEECPEKNTIKVTVFASSTKHNATEPFCVIDITKKTDRGEKLVARDTVNGAIDVTGTIENIAADRESPTGSILCSKKEEAAGILHIRVSVTGHNEVGAPTGISLSDI